MKYCLFVKNGCENSSFAEKIKKTLQNDSRFEEVSKNPELVVVIGGDGTFLKAAHEVFPSNPETRFLPFNAGTIGFYNDFGEDDVTDIPSIVFDEKYPLAEVDTLEAKIGEKRFYAWNEFNITGLDGNIDYDLLLGSSYLEHYFGAGLIISTPTGSFAYNRSLRGAIIDPSLHLMEITEAAPISSKAHKTIGNPTIISKDRCIHLKADSNRGGFLYADGIRMAEEKMNEIDIYYSKVKLHSYIKKDDYFLDRLHKTIDL